MKVIQNFWILNGPIKDRLYHLPNAVLDCSFVSYQFFPCLLWESTYQIDPLQGTARTKLDEINSKSHLCDLMGKHSSSILRSKITQSRILKLHPLWNWNRLAGATVNDRLRHLGVQVFWSGWPCSKIILSFVTKLTVLLDCTGLWCCVSS